MHKTLKSILVFMVLGFPGFVSISQAQDLEKVRRLILILDYVAADYVLAVSQGEVLDIAEYEEMVAFTETAKMIYSHLALTTPNSREIRTGIAKLSELIHKKADPDRIAIACGDIRGHVLSSYPLPLAPKIPPNYLKGKQLYQRDCVLCHAADGSGKTRMAQTLVPPPRSFLDPKVMETLTPFRAFNTMTLGLEGTAMVPFTHLTPDQRWDLAYYLFTLQFSPDEATEGASHWAQFVEPPPLDFRDLASTSDAVLAAKLLTPETRKKLERPLLAYFRRNLVYQESFPALKKAEFLLVQSLSAARAGQHSRASDLALDAYLQGFESAERRLLILNPELVRKGEKIFLEYRGSLDSQKDMAVIQSLYQELIEVLHQSHLALEKESDLSPQIAFASSFIILFREGLEAVLVVSAILALLAVSAPPRAARWVHVGWITALGAGAMTWGVAQWLIDISAMQREILEGLSALLAAAVLFYVSFWLLSRAEAKAWKHFIETKIQTAMTRQKLWALAGVSFLAVYREVFETILFYQVLLSQGTQNHKAILGGAGTGALCLAAVAIALFRFQMKIPIRYFFTVTSSLLTIFSVVLAGKGIHELQEAGWISVSPVALGEIPVLGIFATWETLGLQGLMIAALAIGLMILARSRAKQT